jgi:hypothetical protein
MNFVKKIESMLVIVVIALFGLTASAATLDLNLDKNIATLLENLLLQYQRHSFSTIRLRVL